MFGAAQGLQLRSEVLRLRGFSRQGIHHHQTAVGSELGEDRLHGSTIGLLVDLLGEVFVGRIGEGTTAAAPQRRRAHTGAGTTRSLLTPRLFRRVVHVAAIELRAGAHTSVRLVGHHELVHQGFVVFTTEHGIGSSDFRRFLALFIEYIEFH